VLIILGREIGKASKVDNIGKASKRVSR